jgi:hypothetical protein
MSKLLSALLLGAVALGMNSTAMAADRPATDDQARDNQTQAQPNSPNRKPDQRDAQAGANDPTQHNQTANQADKAGADEGNMGRAPDQPGGDVTAKEKEYLAEIKKCESLTGEQKTQCTAAAKKKAGQM